MHCLDRGARGAVGCHKDDVADANILSREALQNLDPVLIWHAQVDQEQVRFFDWHDAQDFAAALGFERVVAFALEQLDQRAANRRVVVGDQDSFGLWWPGVCPLAWLPFCRCDHYLCFLFPPPDLHTRLDPACHPCQGCGRLAKYAITRKLRL